MCPDSPFGYQYIYLNLIIRIKNPFYVKLNINILSYHYYNYNMVGLLALLSAQSPKYLPPKIGGQGWNSMTLPH